MTKLNLKPLSVNDAWKGKRFRTDKYKIYTNTIDLMLKWHKIPRGKLKLVLRFGFSSKGSDIDNPIKPLVDVLQKKYLFNDNRIYKLDVEKFDVKKGEEYMEFEFQCYE